jgi:lipopolysaccharide transport system ATP-binding protein
MSDIAIKVEDISKQYRLGQIGTGSLAHDVNRWWYRVRGKEDPYLRVGEKNDRTQKGQGQYVWALKDVNFEVKKGEVLGIIGRNGAGKSTLLKILSRTTSPSVGNVKIRGRVASLLEVGTGFHPELTGRENIFLNGAILGMTKKEITRKFDEVVDFAGVERYVDTPVKRFSSGMYVRLAFGVAAHLESEILIVDEVLAVGDGEFQKKCLGKMREVSTNEGRTVLFVSHQMGTIAQLCNRGMLMEQGTVKAVGNTYPIIEKYMVSSLTESGNVYNYKANDKGKKIYFTEVKTVNANNEYTDQFKFDERVCLECDIKLGIDDPNTLLSVTLQDKYGYYISTSVKSVNELIGNGDTRKLLIKYPSSIIAPNNYFFRLALFKTDNTVYDLIENICPIKVNDTGSPMAKFEGIDYGQVLLDLEFRNV